MGAPVTNLRPDLDTSVIVSGAPIRSDTWQALGSLANWIDGHGTMCVPWCYPGHTITSGATDVFRFYIKPKAQTRQRIWVVLCRAASSAGSLEIAAPTGATRTAAPLATTRDRVTPIVFRETVTTSTTANEINLDIKAIGANVTVDAIACYEQSRAELGLNTTDDGIAIESCRARQPIIDAANRSLAGVLDAYDALDARRSSLLQWAVPSGAAPFTTSGTYQAVFEDAPMVVAPVIDSTLASCTYNVRCYLKATGGSIFAQATTTAGSVSASTSSTSFIWLFVGAITTASEDLTDDDGLPSGGWDTCKIEIKCGTGTKAEIAGVSVLRETLPL
jgi:hypothetical protein